MARFFSLWDNVDNTAMKRSEKLSRFLLDTNEKFKAFIINCSWFVYFVASMLIVCCFYYYFYDCKRRTDLRRRRQEVQRANERIPQRRRPGAIYRDHEIFRNVIKTVRQYIGANDDKGDNKPFMLRRTRSGAIYGRFTHREGQTVTVQ